jgi:hypothetical protein
MARGTPTVKGAVTTSLTPAELVEIERALSQARLRPYIAAGGNREKGIALYTRNIRLCCALYPTLDTIQVVLRNAIHSALSGPHGSNWYSNGRFRLEPREQRSVNAALATLVGRGKPRTPSRVVAELNFGFWTALFNRHYEVSFWRPHARTLLPHASPSDRNVKQIHHDLEQIRELRNRVFHYEPIWSERTLVDSYIDAHRIIAWISPASAKWLGTIDDFPEVYSASTPP